MRPHYPADSIRKGLVSPLKLAMKRGKGGMRPRPPDRQSVLEPNGRFVAHNRVRGAEVDRVQAGGTFAGEHGHQSSLGMAVACTGGCPPGCCISVTRDEARCSSLLILWYRD